MDGVWFVYLVLAAFPGLIAFATIYKYMQVRQAAGWPSAPGRVVISTTEARSVKSGGTDSDDTEIRTFAKVVYEYKVATRTYRGDRVSIGVRTGATADQTGLSVDIDVTKRLRVQTEIGAGGASSVGAGAEWEY